MIHTAPVAPVPPLDRPTRQGAARRLPRLSTLLAGWSCSTLAAAAALAVWLFGAGTSLWAWPVGALLLAAGVVLDRRGAAREAAFRRDVAAHVSACAGVGRELVPVWRGQIESSRLQMETAIAELSGRFAGIVVPPSSRQPRPVKRTGPLNNRPS